MIDERTIAELRRVSDEFPQSSKVWHRANGSCGIVCGWQVCGRDVLVVAEHGPGVGTAWHMPGELSGSPVSNDDGDEWRGAGHD